MTGGNAASYRVGFCVSGYGRLFRTAVEMREVLGIEPTLLVADEKAQDLSPFCRENGVAYRRIHAASRPEFDREIHRVLSEEPLDLLVLTFDKLLRPEVLELFPGRIINVHPSLLPSFVGFNAVAKALEAGVKFAGATIHEVNEEVDAGSIVGQCAVPVHPGDTADTLGERVYASLEPMYLQVLAWYAARRVWKDDHGRLWVRGADYSGASVSPRVEEPVLRALSARRGGD